MKKSILLFLLSFFSLVLVAQQKTIFVMEGTVVDSNDEPFEGVSIYLKDKISIGTISDSQGKFSIKASRGDIIVFSFVEHETEEHLVFEEKKDIHVQMKESGKMDEVVVVGMGKQRKISSVAAITSVDVSELQAPTTSIANLLGGRAAGIITTMSSGEPGKNIAEFWVRGIGTFGANDKALVLIDGLEGDLNSLDAADLESFTILKDASSTAVYGIRGANGVILVNTKKGLEGKLQITGRSNFSLSHLKRMPEYLGAYEYAKLVNETLTVRGDAPYYSPLTLDIIKYGLDQDLYPDVNWQKEILNPVSVRQSHYLSARGGGSVSQYFISLGFSNESAAYRQDKNSVYSSNVGYNTYNYRTNLNINLTKSTNVYFGTDGYLAIRNEPGISNTDYLWNAQAQLTPMMFPKVYSNGMFPSGGTKDMSSPYVMINNTGQASTQNYSGKVTLALNQDLGVVLEGLKIKVQGAYDISNNFNEKRTIMPALYRATERTSTGELVMKEMVKSEIAKYESGTEYYRKYHFESNLNYEKSFGERNAHRVSGLIYYYISDQKNSKDRGNIAAIPVRYQGVSSRLTYSYIDTYMVDVNFGYTGSENFQPGRQYGFFPSIAGGWIPSNYDFIKNNLRWLNFLKIRGSYGTVGNDRLADAGRFPYMSRVNFSTGSAWTVNSRETIVETSIGADNLAWERAIKSDLGIEGRFWNDKISFVVDFFNDQRDGIFQRRVQIPEYAGLISMPYGNVGKMKSFGGDGNVTFIQELTKDMRLTLRANYTYSRNVVQNWEDVDQDYPYLERTGWPHNIQRGYRALGLFKNEDDVKSSPRQTEWGAVQAGDIKYMDVNGDGKIDKEDMVPLSYSNYPLSMYGLGMELRYKNLTFGVLFKGRGKTDFFHVGIIDNNGNNNGMGYIPFFQGERGNVLTIAKDPKNRWIPMEYALANGIDPALAENPNARFPKLQYGNNFNNTQLSDFWKGDARYLRLQEVTVSYNLKHNTLKRIGISSIDLQLTGSNIFIWDKVKLFDPEQAEKNGRAYPLPGIYSLQFYINL